MGKKKDKTENMGIVSQCTSFFAKTKNQVVAKSENRNDVYLAVMALRDRTIQVLKANKSDLTDSGQEKVIKAAESFITDLTNLLDSQTKIYQNIHINHQLLLADDCLDIIFKHQAHLEAAPGFWNQLKAFINDCVEYLFNVKNTLSTEGTVFNENDKFQECKDEISDHQERLMKL